MATASRRAERSSGRSRSVEEMRYEASFDAYVLTVEPVRLEDGNWAYRAEYPQLPGVDAVAATAVEAVDAVDRCRDEYLRLAAQRGEPAPRGWPRRHVPPADAP